MANYAYTALEGQVRLELIQTGLDVIVDNGALTLQRAASAAPLSADLTFP
jgi:hypothetical protein